MKTAFTALLAFHIATGLSAFAQVKEARLDFSPQKTWVFLVGVLTEPGWLKGRRDVELSDHFIQRDIPKDHIILLKDKQATLPAIQDSFQKMLQRTRAGDLLFVYFTGHGVRNAKGSAFFCNHGSGADVDKTCWSVKSIFDEIDNKFKGSNILLAADCCYSGGLVKELKSRGKSNRHSFVCYASSQSSEVSTGRWTFSDSLIKGLKGDSFADLNNDRKIQVGELGKFIAEEMAFVDGQMASYHVSGKITDGMFLSKSSKLADPILKQRKEVLWGGKWYSARILQKKEAQHKIHYEGWGNEWDEWITAERIRQWQPVTHKKGTSVEVEWNGQWYPAKILDNHLGVHYIIYDGYPDHWNEWVSLRRLRNSK